MLKMAVFVSFSGFFVTIMVQSARLGKKRTMMVRFVTMMVTFFQPKQCAFVTIMVLKSAVLGQKSTFYCKKATMTVMVCYPFR
ncbi:MAG: hypothetical protein RR049_01290 [Angelakisella sp.]